MRKRTVRLLAVLAIAAALVPAGCGRADVAYVDTGADYSTEQLDSLLARTDAGSVAAKPYARAVELRHSALVALRSQGKAESAAADLITSIFPAATASVPVRVERAKVDGKDAIVLVEAWGKSGEVLSMKRLWVIDPSTGAIRYSAVSGH